MRTPGSARLPASRSSEGRRGGLRPSRFRLGRSLSPALSRSRASFLLSLAGLLALAGCGDGGGQPGGHTVVVDTLASGALQVTNQGPGRWGGEARWRLEEQVVLGGVEEVGPELFGAVSALGRGAEGEILVLDSQAAELRIFAADGTHLRTVGRRGGGPGEFGSPVGMPRAPDGTFWVVDPNNARYTALGVDGEVRHEVRRPLGYFAVPWPGGFDPEGRLLDVASSTAMVRVTPDGIGPDSVALPRREERRIQVQRTDGTMTMSVVPPFAPRLRWRLDPQGYLWSAVSDELRFVQQSLSGDTIRVVVAEHRPVRTTPVEADSAEAAIREMIARSAGDDARVEGDFRAPSNKPAFVGFHVDDEGRLWVEMTQEAGVPRAFRVFDPEGVLLGDVAIPDGLETVNVAPLWDRGTLTALVTNELGIPTVVHYRVVERD